MSQINAEQKAELFRAVSSLKSARLTPPAPEGLTPTETHIMLSIAARACEGEEVRPGWLAEQARVTPSALSQTLGALDRKGFIERKRAKGDSRVVTITLTAAGEEFASAGRAAFEDYMSKVMECLGAEDVDNLIRILGKISNLNVMLKEQLNAGDRPCVS